MADRFHRAAKDGFLDILKEATKRDCNHPDEDGLTPTGAASHEGNFNALRLLISRGGDPDKSDYYGNTSLHCAAARGHLNCVSYLVNFGANIWATDNEFHTAKDLAAMNNRLEILRYLDTQEAKQEKEDPKKAKKTQEKSKKETEKRQKEFIKIQDKLDRKRAEEQLKVAKKEKSNIENTNPAEKKSGLFGTITKTTLPFVSNAPKPPNMEKGGPNSPSFSVLTQNSQNNKKTTMGGIQRRILKKKVQEENKTNSGFKVREIGNEGQRSIRNLSGVRGGSDVFFVQNASLSSGSSCSESPTMGRRGKLSDVFDTHSPEPTYIPGLLTRTKSVPDIGNARIPQSTATLFGFGELRFMRQNLTPTLSAIESKSSDSHSSHDDGLPSEDSSLPFEEEDLPSDDDEISSPIYLFLVANGLENYIPFFEKEHVDLEALMLLTDKDLEGLKLPLGPRRKLLKAIQERKMAIETPGEVVDVRL